MKQLVLTCTLINRTVYIFYFKIIFFDIGEIYILCYTSLESHLFTWCSRDDAQKVRRGCKPEDVKSIISIIYLTLQSFNSYTIFYIMLEIFKTSDLFIFYIISKLMIFYLRQYSIYITLKTMVNV